MLSWVLRVLVVLEDDSDRAVELVETDDGVSVLLSDNSDVSKVVLERLLGGISSVVVDEIGVKGGVWSFEKLLDGDVVSEVSTEELSLL